MDQNKEPVFLGLWKWEEKNNDNENKKIISRHCNNIRNNIGVKLRQKQQEILFNFFQIVKLIVLAAVLRSQHRKLKSKVNVVGLWILAGTLKRKKGKLA